MTLGTILIMQFIDMICRCIMFIRRDIKWKYAVIPGVNKYWLGKLVKSKKLGIANAISHTLFWLYFWFCFGLEIWVLQNYSAYAYIPKDGTTQSMIQIALPDNLANILVWSKYLLIAFAVVTIILWSMMMWRFTIQHKRNPWWICLWAVIPVIPYIYFASISDVVSIDGKRYSLQKVEIKDTKKK